MEKSRDVLPILGLIALCVLVVFSCDARFLIPQIHSISVSPKPANPGDTVTIIATVEKGVRDIASVEVDLSAFGLAVDTAMFDDGLTGGDVTALDRKYTVQFTVPSTNADGVLPGSHSILITIEDDNVPPLTSNKSSAVEINNIAPDITDALADGRTLLWVPTMTLPHIMTITADLTEQNGHNATSDDLASPGFVRAEIPQELNNGTPLDAAMYDDGTNGDVAANDSTFTCQHTVPVGTVVGNYIIVVRAKWL